MQKPALYTAGAIFAVVSAAHWFRYLQGTEVVAGGTTIPLSWSLIGGIVGLVLALWMIIAARRP